MGKDKKEKDRKRDKKEKKERKEKRSSRDKDKRRNKDKEKRKHRRRSSSPSGSSSSSSGSDAELGVQQQLAMGRAAARATREILAYKPELRRELRELVRQLDSGGALDVTGIPDAFLRSRLLSLFDNLVQLRKNSAGQYFLRRGASTVLSFVAPILEESAEQLAPYRQASQQHAQAEAAAAAAEAARQAGAAQPPAAEQQGGGGEGGSPAARQIGPAGPPARAQQQEQQEGLLDSDADGSEDEGGGAVAIGPIGPAAPPQGASAGQEGEEQAQAAGAAEADEGDEEDAAAAGQRVAGPAMPPAEWLAAAAQMEYPVSEGEEEEEEEEEDLLVGPPPPEVVEELDLASMDDRTAEVSRVLRVLQLHEREHSKSTAAEKAERPPDAYDVLGVAHDAVAGDVKKRYWRLSLLVHPDKCDHPRAHDAFQAVTAAAKELQDASLRKRVDERREEAELRREFAAQAAQAERERQWRIARGEATAEDLAGPAAVPGQPVVRETWMTDLPPEKRAGVPGAMPSGPFQGFNQRGVQSRGDTSGWTMTPQQRALQLEGDGAAAGGPLMLTSGGGAAGGADRGVAAANPVQAARMAAAVDAFNSQSRKKTLMELHAERLAGGRDGKDGDKKKRKKAKAGEGGGGGTAADLGYDPTAHPWRPFDREKDLGPGLEAKANAADLLKGTRALGSKFSGGQGGGRTFL